MAERFNSTAESGASAAWSPAGESFLQLKSEDPAARVNILARVDANADWVVVGQLNSRSVQIDDAVLTNRLVTVPAFPFLMLDIAANTDGKLISVRDNT